MTRLAALSLPPLSGQLLPLPGDENPAPELGADQDHRELIDQLLCDDGDHLPGDE